MSILNDQDIRLAALVEIFVNGDLPSLTRKQVLFAIANKIQLSLDNKALRQAEQYYKPKTKSRKHSIKTLAMCPLCEMSVPVAAEIIEEAEKNNEPADLVNVKRAWLHHINKECPYLELISLY